MPLIHKLSIRLQNHPKRIVFPEGNDERIIQAARQFASRRLGVPILIGNRSEIKEKALELNISLEGVRIIEPERSDDFEFFKIKLEGLKRIKNLGFEPDEIVKNPNYYATLMVATGRADAMVSGASATASSALRPILQIIPLQKDVKSVSSVMILDMEDSNLGTDGTLFMTDCGVLPEPDVNQLSNMAISAGNLAYHLTNANPKVAFLAYSSKSKITKLSSVEKMKAAAALAHSKAQNYPNIKFEIDGELQVDAALDPFVAKIKKINSSVAGKANILVFPDLNSGNIAFKLAQIISGAKGYGQILTGLAHPCGEISRAASAHDIFGTAVIVAAQAVDEKFLYLRS